MTPTGGTPVDSGGGFTHRHTSLAIGHTLPVVFCWAKSSHTVLVHTDCRDAKLTGFLADLTVPILRGLIETIVEWPVTAPYPCPAALLNDAS
jgi:hypothetical protein